MIDGDTTILKRGTDIWRQTPASSFEERERESNGDRRQLASQVKRQTLRASTMGLNHASRSSCIDCESLWGDRWVSE